MIVVVAALLIEGASQHHQAKRDQREPRVTDEQPQIVDVGPHEPPEWVAPFLYGCRLARVVPRHSPLLITSTASRSISGVRRVQHARSEDKPLLGDGRHWGARGRICLAWRRRPDTQQTRAGRVGAGLPAKTSPSAESPNSAS